MFISVLMVSTRAVSLMGSTMPLVPRTDIPPTMPSLGLKVFSASVSPSGIEMTTSNPPVYPVADMTSSSASFIMLLGTRLIAAFPTGWSSPFLVTLPTPFPPSIPIPESVFVTLE